MKKYFLILFNVLLFTIIVSSCSKLSVDDSKNKNVSNNEFINIETANIYNDKNNWLNIPNNIDQKVDVFYVYPTVCSDPVMCKYTDPKMRS
jgi:hypothetical protein